MPSRTLLCLALLMAVFSISAAESTPAEHYRKAMSLLVANTSQSDQDEALNLLRSTASQGYAPSQTALGTLYQRGILVTPDIQTAIAWYKKSAEQGDWIAQFSLGWIYFHGGSVPRDQREALRWFEQGATDPHDSSASFYVGLLYDQGPDIPTNYALAAKWYRQSSERGNTFAMVRLASLLLNGHVGPGGQAGREQAFVLLLVAAELGNHSVQPQIDSLGSDLGRNAAREARRKALDLRDQILAVTRQACAQWEDQYGEWPSIPPLSVQVQCERW